MSLKYFIFSNSAFFAVVIFTSLYKVILHIIRLYNSYGLAYPWNMHVPLICIIVLVSILVIGERSERDTQDVPIRDWRYMYIYVYRRTYVRHNSSAGTY